MYTMAGARMSRRAGDEVREGVAHRSEEQTDRFEEKADNIPLTF